MKILSKKSSLSGEITVPGSKSHTIRALLFSSIAEGTSHIKNPLPGADCISSSQAVKLFGAKVDISNNSEWIVEGAGKNAHLPSNVVDCGDSGSLLYFMSPMAAIFDGFSVFTGDESLRTRPVLHLLDALKQMGAQAYTLSKEKNSCPVIIKGPVKKNQSITTDGKLSQYISGIMMASTQLNGKTHITLTDPKETPFLEMTCQWLKELGAKVEHTEDFKSITVTGPTPFKSFTKTIPSDWEAVAFPLIAAILTDSHITIKNIDDSKTQGDRAIVEILKSIGADITEQKTSSGTDLIVKGGKFSKNKGFLSTENHPDATLHVNISGFPDAICALSVCAAFTQGKIVIDDVEVCRKKETDRVKVLQEHLSKLGAKIYIDGNSLIIEGKSKFLKSGEKNPDFALKGGTIESYNDHRIAMAFACMGLALEENQEIIINNAECSSVSFPDFYNVMNKINAGFSEI